MSFLSRRRRHTRLQGDWSSDVCSSDLFSIFDLRFAIAERRARARDRRALRTVFQSQIENRKPKILAALLLTLPDRKSVVQGKRVDRRGGLNITAERKRRKR